MENEKKKQNKMKMKRQGGGRDMSRGRPTGFIRGERRQNTDSRGTGGYDVDPAAALTGQTVANNAFKSHRKVFLIRT